MPKAKSVSVVMNLNDARSLLSYLDLFAKAMSNKKGPVFQLFNRELASADWMAAVRAKGSIEECLSREEATTAN